MPKLLYLLALLLVCFVAVCQPTDGQAASVAQGDGFDWEVVATIGAAAVAAGWSAFRALKWATLGWKGKIIANIAQYAVQVAYKKWIEKHKTADPDAKVPVEATREAMREAKQIVREVAAVKGVANQPEVRDDALLEGVIEQAVLEAKEKAGNAPKIRRLGKGIARSRE